jgi:8-oxo-dGTP pyrophosphatase MutT (NUDIX family)
MTTPRVQELRFDDVIARLRALPDPLPKPPAALMPVRIDNAERPRAWQQPGPTARDAAVLVLLVPAHDGSASVILTVRVDRGGHHSGEVSFPGGRTEPDDADAAATALREAAEEIALDAAAAGVDVLAQLESFWIPVSDFRVTPVVAVARSRPLLSPSPDEVARILEAPLAAFMPGAHVEMVERDLRGWRIRYGAYPVEGLLVWGATARILGQLGAIFATSAG